MIPLTTQELELKKNERAKFPFRNVISTALNRINDSIG